MLLANELPRILATPPDVLSPAYALELGARRAEPNAVLLQWDLTAALSGCVCPATTGVVLAQKSVFNLSVDLV